MSNVISLVQSGVYKPEIHHNKGQGSQAYFIITQSYLGLKRKVIQRVLMFTAFFYGGLHLTFMGLAHKFTSVSINYISIAIGLIAMLTALSYFVIKCILYYRKLTAKKGEESES
ncbi:hypothetical protein [Sphingobacterium paludis]|nr:hypothetical protein [Sphingobacterium paludis]